MEPMRATGESSIRTSWQKVWEKIGGTWLVTLSLGVEHSHGGGGHILAGYPQTWAVVDDFGTLVAVEAYK